MTSHNSIISYLMGRIRKVILQFHCEKSLGGWETVSDKKHWTQIASLHGQ
jgi:hypothetical protein